MKFTATVGLGDAIELLQSEGFDNANGPRIHHAITAGHIKRPGMDRSLCYRFSQKDLRAIRAYLSDVPSPGRRPVAVQE